MTEVFKHLGLSLELAASRLGQEGANELAVPEQRSAMRIILSVLREPMVGLLLLGGAAYLLLGDRVEALILLLFAAFSLIVTVMQEVRTEHLLEKLRDLSPPRALVIREGVRLRIAGREVVRDDLLVLEPGDRIPADAVLLEVSDLQTDESLLTGEALPVAKVVLGEGSADVSSRAGGDNQPFVYAGTLVARGNGIARVIATGPRSEMGRIGKSLVAMDVRAPRLQHETTRIVTWCAFGGAIVAVLVVVLYGLSRGSWIEAALAGIAIGMSMLPEEFPVVLTVFLAMGAWRIGKAGVLTRRSAGIETLGSATVLCTDKTGTLTENRMVVAALWLPAGYSVEVVQAEAIPVIYHPLLSMAALASAVEPSDPMEIAIHQAWSLAVTDSEPLGSILHAYPLRPDLLAMSNVREQGNAFTIAAKGAPEAISDLCHLTPEQHIRMMTEVEVMAARGIRVLAVASGVAPSRDWASSQRNYAYTLCGLVGLADPLRTSVPAAIAECRRAGIRVVMITGDHPATAASIARQAGIADGAVLTGDVLEGKELALLDDGQLASRLTAVTIFARIMPEQKLRIVEALQAAGEVVAMTGDGVNDAPSLKAADIGVAMGKRGTDVAREAAAIVLLEDDFGSIVQAIRLGRRIYDNLRKAMTFIFAVHVPIAGLAVLPLCFGLPIIFGPIHIALLEMVIDPVCAIVFEAEGEEEDIMRRPPRDPTEALFSFSMLVWSFLQGGIVFGMLSALLFFGQRSAMVEQELRGLIFFALVAQMVVLILVNRSFTSSLREALTRSNLSLHVVLAVIISVMMAILLSPKVQSLLKFGSMSWQDIALIIILGIVSFILLEGTKPLIRMAILRQTGQQSTGATLCRENRVTSL
jgi:Ca2+-transporting ATPase